MNRLRVVHFELDENLGGIETFLLNLYKQIDRENIQFEFITAVEKPALEQKFLELGGIVHHVSAHKDFINYYKDVKKILESGVDIIHVHKNSAANIIPIMIGKKCKINKIFVHSHNTAPSTGKVSMLLHWINRPYLNRSADMRLACSTEAGRWLFGGKSFEVLPNGIPAEVFYYEKAKRYEKRRELGINDSTLVFGNIGRFTKQKNQVRAVDIFSSLETIEPNSIMLFVGEGEFRQCVEKHVKDKKLTNKVKFLGLRYDIPELLMAMDCFLMPSLYEGLPIVAIEAQAAGLPMFLSDAISPETEITDAINWFSLNETNLHIAQMVMKIMTDKRFDRHLLFHQVIMKGYDMKETAAKLVTSYRE